MIEPMQKLFAYDMWSISRILDSLLSSSSPNQRALGLLAHLLVSEKIWLLRLQGQDTSAIDKSPELSLAECESLAKENQRAYADFLGSLNKDDLDWLVKYRNFSGTKFDTAMGDILTHVVLHGTYHRGQIATAMRAAGLIPVDTDFITFVRETGG